MNEEPLHMPDEQEQSTPVHPEQGSLLQTPLPDQPVDPNQPTQQPDPLPADSPPVSGTPSQEQPDPGDYPAAQEGYPDTAEPPSE